LAILLPVLGVLLLIAIAALIFLCLRRAARAVGQETSEDDRVLDEERIDSEEHSHDDSRGWE
jgi:hypothetical protein